MSAAYDQLLDAAIQHLEDLKSRGVRNVAVAPETLRALAQPPLKNFCAGFKPAAETSRTFTRFAR